MQVFFRTLIFLLTLGGSTSIFAQGDWFQYEIELEKVPSLVQVDMQYRYVGVNHPNLIILTCPTTATDGQGIASLEEREAFDVLDYTLDSLFNSYTETYLAGIIYSAKKREVFVYCASDTTAGYVLSLYEEMHPEAPVYTGDIRKDARWDAYFYVLLPPPLTLLSYDVSRQLQEFSSQGDNPLTERDIVYELYFLQKKQVDKFEEDAIAQGFQVVRKSNLQSEPEEDCYLCFEILISKPSITEEATIQKSVEEVFLLGEKHHGEFSRWWCDIMTE